MGIKLRLECAAKISEKKDLFVNGKTEQNTLSCTEKPLITLAK